MTIRALVFALSFALLLPALGCATSPPPVTKIVAGKRIVTRSVSPHAYEHAARALIYEDEGRFEEAAAEYQRALSYDGDAPELHARLAEAFLALGRTEDAEGAIARSLGIEPTTPGLVAKARLDERLGRTKAAIEALGRARTLVSFEDEPDVAESVYLELADVELRALEPAAAAATLSALCERHTTSLAGRMRDAAVAWATGDVARAERRYREALAIEPAAVEASLELAQLYAGLGREEEARRTFQDALDRSEGALDVAGIYARWLVGQGKLDDARQLADDLAGPSFDADRLDLERVVKRPDKALALVVEQRKDESDAEARHRLALAEGVLLSELGRTTDAVATLLAVPDSAELFEDARLRAAELLREAGRLDEAKRALAPLEAEGLDAEERVELAIARALIEEKAGDPTKAARTLDQAGERLGPGDDEARPRLRLARAALEERRGNWRAALALVDEVLRHEVGNVEALNLWGYVAADHGHELPRALGRLQAALAFEPASAAIIDSVGWAHFRAGRIAAAKLFLEQAARLLPEDPEVLSHTAALAEQSGDKPRAIAALRKALAQKMDEPLRKRLQESLGRIEATEAARP